MQKLETRKWKSSPILRSNCRWGVHVSSSSVANQPLQWHLTVSGDHDTGRRFDEDFRRRFLLLDRLLAQTAAHGHHKHQEKQRARDNCGACLPSHAVPWVPNITYGGNKTQFSLSMQFFPFRFSTVVLSLGWCAWYKSYISVNCG